MEAMLAERAAVVSPLRLMREVRIFFRMPVTIRQFISKAQEIEAIGEAISVEGHSVALMELAAEFGRAANLSEDDFSVLQMSVELHDIGKLPIPQSILQKPDKLTDEEYDFIKQHTKIGFLILRFIGQIKIARIILSHHERWDGKGYPFGTSGNDIPFLSQIVSIIDAYDAMTCDRVYRKALTPLQAIRTIILNSGAQFNPDLVEIFVKVWEKRYGDLI